MLSAMESSKSRMKEYFFLKNSIEWKNLSAKRKCKHPDLGICLRGWEELHQPGWLVREGRWYEIRSKSSRGQAQVK